MAPEHSFLTALRLKLMITLLRFLIGLRVYLPMERRDKELTATTCPGVKPQTLKIPSREPGRFIDAVIYFPPNYSINKPTPVLLNWHGSGFVVNMLGSDAYFCSRVAQEAGYVVLDCGYRKAPETPWPGPVEDAEDALAYLTSSSALQTFNFDIKNAAVSGFSAGGCLALLAASSAVRPKELRIKAAVGVYPVTDLSIRPEAKRVEKPVKPLPVFMMNLFNSCYAFDEAVRKDPRCSPAFAELESYPERVLMLSCSGDVLMPEARALADRLDDGKGGRKVVNLVLEGMPHGFDKGCKEGSAKWRAREEGYGAAVEMLKEARGR
ncbi:Alpha/Beta hydrolase protein [Clohesyomyces aquaticus]|uniref:Alpha/Beta hydrolase protein n=1 Tax=Clohesyomyces aquaticus TaxID=1231657 RepID=A0A1Y1ZBA4_9PLEO|nr:Alpha/Beta hydrolase protein [Clohesyomyces aquaticus]